MNTIIELKNISLITKNNIAILNNINYSINQGDFVILLGSNGSGKSSLLKLLDQRYHFNQGEIHIHGKAINQYSPAQLTHIIATLTQHCNESLFPSLTVIENYSLIKNKNIKNIFQFSRREKTSHIMQYLNQFNINLKDKLNTLVDNLSGGEKQALALALNLLNPPDILLLDEHTSALDPNTRKSLMTITDYMIKKYRMTCILTTHDLDIAANYGNRILAIKQGKISYTLNNKSIISHEQLLATCY